MNKVDKIKTAYHDHQYYPHEFNRCLDHAAIKKENLSHRGKTKVKFLKPTSMELFHIAFGILHLIVLI
jgi:hypothetical protein